MAVAIWEMSECQMEATRNAAINLREVYGQWRSDHPHNATLASLRQVAEAALREDFAGSQASGAVLRVLELLRTVVRSREMQPKDRNARLRERRNEQRRQEGVPSRRR